MSSQEVNGLDNGTVEVYDLDSGTVVLAITEVELGEVLYAEAHLSATNVDELIWALRQHTVRE